MTPPGAAYEEVTGAILIGGRSRRLGRDKVLLPYGGKPLVLHIHRLLTDLFARVLLIGHPRTELKALELSIVPDLVPGRGILGGIYTALTAAVTPYVFVTGADMPLLTPSLISGVLKHRFDADAVIPRGPTGLEPLCAIYSRTCTETLEHHLQKGTLRILDALEGLPLLYPEILPTPGEPDPFFNINLPEDLEKFKNRV